MDMAVRELAQNHKRSLSGEIEFLVEEAIKNNAELAQYALLPERRPAQTAGGKPTA
jgi:hypothetical protein